MEVEGCRVRSTLKCDKTCSGSATVYREEDISVSMQTHTPKEDGACVGTEMSVQQHVPICRTSNLNPPRLTSRRSQPPLAPSVPLSRFASPVGGGSAFYVRCHRAKKGSKKGVKKVSVPAIVEYCLDSQVRGESIGDMARKLRVQYPGAIYHVINRGDRREPIFKDDQDHRRFLETLGEACGKTGWQVHAYCLMLNHFHLVLETPNANLVAGMKWFLGTYTSRFNRRHKLFGHLFSGRYKSLIVDGSGDGYLRTVCDYVHLNPIRANLLQPEQPLQAYRWSSYPEYLKRAGQRASWLRVDRVLGELGIQRDDTAGRKLFAQAMEERRGKDKPGEWKLLRRGWFLGGAQLREQVLEMMGCGMGAHHGGEEKQEADEQKAQRLVLEELEKRGWTEQDLKQRRKTDALKVKMAARLRSETVMTLNWIARRLQMGCRHTVANCLKG